MRRPVNTGFDNPNDPRGYIYVFAKSPTSGAAISWNYLEGASVIGSSSDIFEANLAPIVYRAIGAPGANTDTDGDGVRDLNGVEYEVSSDQLHIPSFVAFPASKLILLGLTGLGFRTIVSYLAYNDNEEALSGQIQFDCWDIKSLQSISGIFTDSFLESTNDDESDFGFGIFEGGWIRMDGQTAFSTAQQRSGDRNSKRMTPGRGKRFGPIPGRSRAPGRVDPVPRSPVSVLRAGSGAASTRPEALGLRRGARRRHTAPLWSCAARSRRGLPGELGLGRRSGRSDRRSCAGQLEVALESCARRARR